MRTRSHCALHPSREATVRCRGCGKWLCERCARQHGERPFCGRWCQVREAGRGSLDTLIGLVGRPLHPAWTVTAIALLAAVVAVALTPLAGRLVRHRVEPAPTGPESPEISAVMRPADDGWELRLRGPAGAEVLVVERGAPLAVVALDEAGAGSALLHGTPGSTPDVRVVALPGPGTEVAVERARTTPTPGETAAPTPHPTSSATPVPSATPSATPTPSETPRPAPTATPTATPPPSATPSPPPPARSPVVVRPLEPYRGPTATPTPRPTPARAVAGRASRSAPPVLHLALDAGPRIAITFDGGANSSHAAELLDTLAELEVRATLFLTGQFIEREQALVRRALLAGHEIGNHTWGHDHLTTWADTGRHELLPSVTREWFVDQLRRTETAFQRATGRPLAPLWRAPYGEENATLRRWALQEGYLHVRWSTLEGASLDSRDWVADEHSPMYMDSHSMVTRLLEFPHLEGGIVLMHLSTERAEPAWVDLPRFVSSLRERRIEPVRVTELLEASRTWRSWLERARAVDRMPD